MSAAKYTCTTWQSTAIWHNFVDNLTLRDAVGALSIMALVSLAPGARSVASARTPSRYSLSPRAFPSRVNNCKHVGVHGLAQRGALAPGKYLARMPQPLHPLHKPPSLPASRPLKATYHDEPGSVERALAVLTYTLPILDSIHYGE